MFAPLFRSKFLLVGALFGGTAFAGPVSLDNLVTDSPFVLKQEEAAGPAPTENVTVEFRGYQQTPDGMLFGLYDRTKNTGAWVKQGDSSADFRVSKYDPAAEQVVVEYQGQRLNLSLAAPKINAAAPTPLPVVNTGGAPRANPTAANPVHGNDQQRLESVAAEVRRRRALRQAAAAQATPQAPAQTSGQQQ